MSDLLKNVDFLIIGQGLAGSILALKLLERDSSILVIDTSLPGSASSVAAGIINPITGHRLNITNDIECFLPDSIAFFQKLEKQTAQHFIREIPQFRLIKNHGQMGYWHKRKQQTSHNAYLGKLSIDQNHQHFHTNEFGVAEIRQTYQVAVNRLLQISRDILQKADCLIEQEFAHDALVLNGKHTLNYKHIKAKKIIFCEGYRAINNPWWQHLPFKLAKGELLELETAKASSIMLNWGNWFLPSFNGLPNRQLLGATYGWNDTSTTQTPEFSQKLLESLKLRVRSENPIIKEHRTGIRPTTVDRLPFIGPHADSEHVICFNGFGSKGCLTIPYFADKLINYLTLNQPLSDELTAHLTHQK